MHTDFDKSNILYLDQETECLQAFTTLFQNEYTVFTATYPNEALEILRKHYISVIISAQTIPIVTGIEFLESIISEFPETIRMLILAEASDAGTVIDAINKGHVFRLISKPWNDLEFAQSINVGIKISNLERENRRQINKMREESLKKERILNTFRRYVPEHVVKEALIQDRIGIFGGEERIISVVFIQILNVSELRKLDPKLGLKYLNEFFSTVQKVIEEQRGLIDKFEGGKILAVFGAPISYKNDLEDAVFGAINVLEDLKNFNLEKKEKYSFEAQIGIGIHSGPAIVGNIGSDQYISYTAIGDAVNIGARIVELTKNYPNSILISDCYKNKGNENIESLGPIEIRGKKEPIEIYKILEGKFISSDFSSQP